MTQQLTIEQLKFAREIWATWRRDSTESWFKEIDGQCYVYNQYGQSWERSIDYGHPSIFENAYEIDFSHLDDYYADKAVDIAATSVPDGYYHDDESGKLKPLKPAPAPEYDPADVAFKRPENERGAGLKHDSGKPRMSLVPPNALTEMAKVMTFGASKYKAHSWRQVENAQERYLDALLRHAIAYVAGERIDPESGLPTMAHIMCDAAFLIELDMFNDNERTAGVNE